MARAGHAHGMPEAPERPDPLVAGRMRVMQYVSDGCIVSASVALAVFAGNGWAWGPAVVGPAVVVIAAASNAVMFRVGIAQLKPTNDQLRRARARRRNRNVIIVPAYVTFAVAAAVIAGSLESYWPDIVLGAIVVIATIVAPLVLLPRLKRHAEAMRGSGTDTA
jgi:hypothetical protein